VTCGVIEAAHLAPSHGGRGGGIKYANITISVMNLLSLCEVGNTEKLKNTRLFVYKTVLLPGVSSLC
jgi:hypothetical protein